ncbi:MAG: hypothetical protein WCK88_05790 [bacterium]
MNPFLLKLAKFIAQRPKDSTIRMFHIVSGLVIIELLWYSQGRCVLDIPFIGPQSPAIEKTIQTWLLVVGLIPLLKGLMPWCLVKHRTLRISQGIFGLLLIIIGGPIMDPIVTKIPAPEKKAENGFQIDVGATTKESSHPGAIIVIL